LLPFLFESGCFAVGFWLFKTVMMGCAEHLHES